MYVSSKKQNKSRSNDEKKGSVTSWRPHGGCYRDRPRRPSPGVFVVRHAGAQRGGADAHVTRKDVPAFVGGIEIAAAGKRGHAAIKARPGRAGHQSAREITFPSRPAGYFVPVRNIHQCE